MNVFDEAFNPKGYNQSTIMAIAIIVYITVYTLVSPQTNLMSP